MSATKHTAMTKSMLFAAALSLGLSLAPATHAQAQQMPPGANQGQQETVSDQKLQAFVEAQGMLRQVQSQFNTAAEEAASEEEMRAIQQQMNEQMIGAIESTGLTVDEYNAIMAQLQSDPNLQERYMELIG